MKAKHAINLSKGLTFLVVVGLMLAYHNFTLGPWVYLSLHGTYGFMWLLKDRIYPDKQWEQEISILIKHCHLWIGEPLLGSPLYPDQQWHRATTPTGGSCHLLEPLGRVSALC